MSAEGKGNFPIFSGVLVLCLFICGVVWKSLYLCRGRTYVPWSLLHQLWMLSNPSALFLMSIASLCESSPGAPHILPSFAGISACGEVILAFVALIVLSLVGTSCIAYCKGNPQMEDRNINLLASGTLEARNVYQDPHSGHRYFLTFLMQTILVGCYTSGLMNNKYVFDSPAFWRWLAAFLVQAMAIHPMGSSNLLWAGATYEEGNDAEFFAIMESGIVITEESQEGSQPPQLTSFQWKARRMCSYIVNQGYVWFILTTIPILLMNAEHMDFVKNAFAVCFITAIDDLQVPKRYKHGQAQA